jgi:hypothetical protein
MLARQPLSGDDEKLLKEYQMVFEAKGINP